MIVCYTIFEKLRMVGAFGGFSVKIGLDVGSTTMKCVVLDDQLNVLHTDYRRHYSQIPQTGVAMLSSLLPLLDGKQVYLAVSGSAGMGLSQNLKLPFVQEVYATRLAVNQFLPSSDVVIELGGEDAKILFLGTHMEVRMNGTCAGGTGSFIDQMASLLSVDQAELDQLAMQAKQSYSIASRCGVFAKSDVQPLLNQGADKADISLSILQSVVNQTIAGLAQGRPITGQVVYLGGPLTFLSSLRKAFDTTLGLEGICPTNSLFYVAMGSALMANEQSFELRNLIYSLEHYEVEKAFTSIPPLFEGTDAYETFKTRHAKARLVKADPAHYHGTAFLGVDAGSTTVKACVIDDQGRLLHSRYQANNGNPVQAVKEFLSSFLTTYPNIELVKSCSTGYGEHLIKNAFNFEYSLVETMAHYTSACAFLPDVDFIIDIGGQDIKCFKIVDGVIDDIFLNEACSSGCGSFLQTFSNALGYSPQEAAELAVKAQNPVDLGSRCTVFMNSSVKQAQKDGASVADIFAGLAISVVKNALYKVIRSTDPSMLGKHIVVQGGTFLNDAVLRSFEVELGCEVIRIDEAGLMGAYGCALFAKTQHQRFVQEKTALSLAELQTFSHRTKTIHCKGCTNNCLLTVNTFDGERKLISGNKCDRIVSPQTFVNNPETLNIYAFKQQYLDRLSVGTNERGRIGLPLQLNFYEQMPFWQAFFTSLGFEVVMSPPSTRQTYLDGQSTIPSDTICYPAKLMHGHIMHLLNAKVDAIFYPCSSYNIDEEKGDNHFNCPVVAYYPEVLKHNMPMLQDSNIPFISDYLSLDNPRFLSKRLHQVLQPFFPVGKDEVKRAVKLAYQALKDYQMEVRNQALSIIEHARFKHWPIMVLCGRPYHVDSEVNHGIDQLLLQCQCAVLSEDSTAYLMPKEKRSVLNQWTYHARMYDAARYVTTQKDMQLIQLVSFGCGLDAVTSDEIRDILHATDKIYTQIKIDEIANLGAVKIRIRSLLSALKEADAP
ncbi:acyl-CoA dehydratase activase-related protein [Sphaerochaeta sp.]|uniref:acyl-CoA dehydratase activase-related protein n=1 Tax=Sphaerochaeta sp. TaxID=1972642 RepID=UPI003D0DF550